MADDERNEYEISFLGRDEGAAGGVSRALASHGGEVTFAGPVERIELAYKIGGTTAAHFGYFHFRAEPPVIAGIEKTLQTDPLVLRALIVTPPIARREPRGGEGRPKARPYAPADRETAPPAPLSNEALEKRIEEIMK